MNLGSVVVTGASTGIGQALAEYYAAPGRSLTLIGRDAARLAQVADTCRARGAVVEAVGLDVRDREALRACLLRIDAARPVDLVIANAGIALPEHHEGAVYDVFDVNLFGALNSILPLIDPMISRGRGQVALMSSLAALSPLPDAAAYSGAKAALLAFGRALRAKLASRGVRVSVICPGFVATRMGERYKGWRPLEMSAPDAARRIAGGLARDRGFIAFPWPLVWLTRLSTWVPEVVIRRAMRLFGFSIERT